MSEELALGQRNGVEICSTEWTEAELKLVTDNGFTVEEVIRQWVVTKPDATLNALLGSLAILREGKGQERSEPFVSGAHTEPAPVADEASTL